ncbi:alpha-2-macroglobulin family protein [Nannocystis radixulma]|uniref:MG2 domain-containing protein n=1 Tax=Nannocystis radixulma TaxID=2995305 RepID=A0ABT5BCQ6_9BACT|nr:MG2 domain-containing protein [Nannocystis radixulma]MDC0671410.1 MG2 domain-containing protein [Nannocystis radixulma]
MQHPRGPRLRLLPLSPALLALAACQPVNKPATDTGVTAVDEQPAGDSLVRTIPDKAGVPLVFPPPPTDREPRPELDIAGEDVGSDQQLTINWPTLEDGKFEVEGQIVRLRFNRAVKLPGKIVKDKPIAAAAGTITLEPAVAGKAVWTNSRSLEFRAAKPFDPEVTYALAVQGLTTEDGSAMEPWKAGFTAEPRIEIAGKTITYLPTPGDYGVVNVYPQWGGRVRTDASFFVIFDQPVNLKKAEALIDLAYENGEKIAVTLAHLKGSRFEGYTVNPRQVVEIKPTAPLREEAALTLKARGNQGDEFERNFEAAGPLELTKASCGYAWDRNVCDWQSPRLRTDGREVALEFTNRLDGSQTWLKNQVSVTPAVDNLSVWINDTWESTGRVVVSGNFLPSTTYRVALPALKDIYGNTVPPTAITLETTPLAASVAMPEGVMILDGAASRAFTVSSRNTARAEIQAWEVADDAAALARAREQVDRRTAPDGAPTTTITIDPAAESDKFVTTQVDLLAKLKPGKSYVLGIKLVDPVAGAQPIQYPTWMSASRQPLALVTPGDDRALAVHTHVLPEVTLVHVARLATGEAVPGASFSLNGDKVAGRTTDANGFAVLPIGLDRAGSTAVRVEDGPTALTVQLKNPSSENRLFPHYSAESAPKLGDRRGMVITDRGIYRPGAVVHVKASVRQRLGDDITPLAGKPVVVKVIGPTEEELASFPLITDDMGSVAADYTVPTEARLGRHLIVVSEANSDTRLDEAVVQVAEFEPPRFTVDVDAREAKGVLSATVVGKYLFGAAMDKAQVEWTVTREPAALPSGPLVDAGLVFTEQEDEWWEEEDSDDDWSRAGSGQLGPDGTLKISQKLDVSGTVGPQNFTLEADVADTSYRHIAGRGSVVVHPASRYAGLKIARPWSDVGAPVSVQLGVVDRDGKSVEGVPVTARMYEVDWTYSKKPMKGGGYDYQWQRTTKEVGHCTATSGKVPASCDLVPTTSGSYEVRAEVDGRTGGMTNLWAWGRGGDKPVVPSKGRTVELTPDKSRYAPGETAKLLVRSPFPSATAIFTVEQGGLLKQEVRRLDEAAALFEVPITASHAPYIHATVTLLPIGAGDERTDWKIGVLRIPVTFDDVRLSAGVTSDKTTYEPREEVAITVDVNHAGKPVAGAEVALAVVDEGVLRMTNFHAEDPASALRPGQPLAFEVSDSRDLLAALFKHSQTAGDGNASASVTNTRKNFVQTAFWKPDLRTDAAGKATVKFTLPDNLTRFRMMAVVIDKQGKGAAVENDFTVRRPVMMIPVVPRFAATGDKFEAAAMVHNNTDLPLSATVAMNDVTQLVTVPAQGHQRVGFPLTATVPGELKLDFNVRDGSNAVRDAVESVIPVDVPGLAERPHLDGAFVGSQEITLDIPAGILVGRGDKDYIKILVGQHLWPELGARLQYLLDYPHGCVEQTTSSTLPLLAARDILPRIGVGGMTREELDKRIHVGLKRLASMRTSSGGLGYWPGDTVPNVYGTAYAVRALVAAKHAGLALPDGLLEGITEYLEQMLLSDGTEAEVQAAIAHTLSELGALPESAADPLFDRKQHMGVFGLASLAIALDSLKGQDDRVKQLLDEVEASYDADGNLAKAPGYNDFYYFGSSTRTKAQTVIALGRLRNSSVLKARLTQHLADATDSYTTQATAYSLMAIAEQLKNQPPTGAGVTASLDGVALTAAAELGAGALEYRIPVAELRGKKAALKLASDSTAAIAFMVEGAWKRPLDDARGLVATSADKGPDIYRAITDGNGGPIDLTTIKPGQVLRVALLADLPVGDLDHNQMNFLAVTDRLPAGFEPIQPDLWTVARAPDITDQHPFYDHLRWGGSDASYVELRDDRVLVYFDRVWGNRVVATYLVRASTPGTFVLPPASAEFMYVGGSHGYSTAGKVEIKP